MSDVAIGTQPTNQTAYASKTATFSVTAGGTGPFTYQWKKDGTDISGATNSSYTTPEATSADIGEALAYSVVVSNSAGTVTSNPATLTVSARYSLVPKASGGTYDTTECVKDNSTGRVWEGKTASPATTRLGTSTYTNYDANYSGGTTITVSTNSIGYKDSVNTSALCGYTDWRLPTKEELQGILASSGSPRIDTEWFLNTQANFYWSSSPYVGNSYGHVGRRFRRWLPPASAAASTATMCAWCGSSGVAYTSVIARHSRFGLALCIQAPWPGGIASLGTCQSYFGFACILRCQRRSQCPVVGRESGGAGVSCGKSASST